MKMMGFSDKTCGLSLVFLAMEKDGKIG